MSFYRCGQHSGKGLQMVISAHLRVSCSKITSLLQAVRSRTVDFAVTPCLHGLVQQEFYGSPPVLSI
jgi:hypothetical protein